MIEPVIGLAVGLCLAAYLLYTLDLSREILSPLASRGSHDLRRLVANCDRPRAHADRRHSVERPDRQDLCGRGQRPHAGPTAGRTPVLSPRRRRRDARADLARLRDGDDRLLDRRLPVALRAAAAAGRAAAQSAAVPRRAVRSRLQHLDQLHHQHQLAELRRRTDDEPSDPDARPHRPQFPLRRDRSRHGLRAGARLRALDRRRRSAISGSI